MADIMFAHEQPGKGDESGTSTHFDSPGAARDRGRNTVCCYHVI